MDNLSTFDVYFASIVGFQYHPANPALTRKSLDECAKIALEMLEIRKRVEQGLITWHG